MKKLANIYSHLGAR